MKFGVIRFPGTCDDVDAELPPGQFRRIALRHHPDAIAVHHHRIAVDAHHNELEMSAGGAAMLHLATIMVVRAGVQLIATQHDSLWILTLLEQLRELRM